MIPVYLIYDNKGNRYGASRSIKKAEEMKTKIENESKGEIDNDFIFGTWEYLV